MPAATGPTSGASFLRQAERWRLQDIEFTDIIGNLSIHGAQVKGPAQPGTPLRSARIPRIGPVAIGPGTTIGDNVLIGVHEHRGQVHYPEQCEGLLLSLYNRVIVGANSTIGDIMDNDTHIGEQCSIENDTVIGPRVVLRDHAVAHSNIRLWPEVVITDGTIVKEYVPNEKFDLRYDGS